MQMLLLIMETYFFILPGGICVETGAHNINVVIFNTRELFSRGWLSFGYVQSTFKEGMVDKILKYYMHLYSGYE